MAQPIPLELPPTDARADLTARLAAAPAEHAEALLAAYDVLQGLHDRGILNVLSGTLGASDKLLETVVEGLKSPEGIRGLRNLIQLVKLLGSVEPESLKVWTRVVPEAMKKMTERTERIGLWRLLRQFRNPDVRRGIAAINTLLETLGRDLSSVEKSSTADVEAPGHSR
jgi:uncharacterized protein YjgD (DUF1641 family)